MTDAGLLDSDVPPPPPLGAIPATKPQEEEEGVRLIFEQILIAFIFAFIFRAFVLEAFVIPTGSMAPTLLGAHMDFDCPDCGWDFKVNYPTDSGQNAVPSHARVPVADAAGGVQAVDRVYSIRCPNCGYRLPRGNAVDPDNDASGPPVKYGDRILVLKHLYLFQSPQRWDVVVFKNPARPRGTRDGLPEWSSEAYQQNYIKRLIGLPGDTLMLLDGDVYVTDANKTLAELTAEDFAIARKDAVAQSALWRIVYDDDHRPQGLPRDYPAVNASRGVSDPAWRLPWTASGIGWSVTPAAEGGGFSFDATDGGGGAGTLAFDADANPSTLALTDYSVYNVNGDDQRSGSDGRRPLTDTFLRDFTAVAGLGRSALWLNTVSDLRLSLYYQRQAGDGPLTLRLSKRRDTFEAELLPGRARLYHAATDGGPRTLLGEAALGGLADRPKRVEFVNADYRVRLVVDGRTLFETTDAQYAPNVARLLEEERADNVEEPPRVEIVAAEQRARLTHVSLWRDTYHTARDGRGQFAPFASPADFPNKVIRLGTSPSEYFVLGDNPFLSGDARVWTGGLSLPYEDLEVQGGRVPGRFMLGRAFFVYWPASHRPGGPLPALVPNVGDMRFIR